jgi:hypothetical protein
MLQQRGRGSSIVLSLVLGTLVPVVATADSDSSSFDYFHIEANEGDSSGGHAAIRFGELTYHFQNQDGLLVLRRDFTREFIYTYALLSNRTIHSSRVAVEPEEQRRLRDRFVARHRIQERQLAVLTSLGEDRTLVESILRASKTERGDNATVDVSVPGAGYFVVDPPARAPTSPSVANLVKAIEERHGSEFLASRRAEIEAGVSRALALDPSGWRVVLPRGAYDEPPHSLPWSARIANLAAGLAAIDVLESGGVIADGALRAPSSQEFALSVPERAAHARHATDLEARLVALSGSRREDWGPAFLAGLARLEALQRSLDSGFLVFVDSYPDDAMAIDRGIVVRRPRVMSNLREEAGHHLAWARRRFVEHARPGEREWTRLEDRANRYLELTRGISEQRAVRIDDGHLVPRRAAPLGLRIASRVSAPQWRDTLAGIREREGDYRRQLEVLHGYHLVTRNCVTEIFATINHGAVATSEIAGRIDGVSGLAFVPFISARKVDRAYPVVERITYESYREARLRELRQADPGIWTALRESNVFTASSYERSEFDSFFIFFTDETVVLRPLMGVVNIAAGLGETLWGGVRAPFDRGQTFLDGLKGTAVSLPELAFINIRKGSNDWVAPVHRKVAPTPATR